MAAMKGRARFRPSTDAIVSPGNGRMLGEGGSDRSGGTRVGKRAAAAASLNSTQNLDADRNPITSTNSNSSSESADRSPAPDAAPRKDQKVGIPTRQPMAALSAFNPVPKGGDAIVTRNSAKLPTKPLAKIASKMPRTPGIQMKMSRLASKKFPRTTR